MALKKTVSTNFGINAEYEDVYKLECRNCNGTKTLTVDMHGWQTKAQCRAGNSHIWSGQYPLILTDDENTELYELMYKLIKAHVSEFSDATSVYDVTAVALDQTALSLTVGATGTLTATCTPDTAEDLTVTWSSSDKAVATVADGVVTAVAAGTAVITATSNDEATISSSCTVTVA